MRDPNFFYPGESLESDEMRVTALGTGMPFCRRGQASTGWLVERDDDRAGRSAVAAHERTFLHFGLSPACAQFGQAARQRNRKFGGALA